MAFTIIEKGAFTSQGVGVRIPLASGPDYFRSWNTSRIGSSGTCCIGGEWMGPGFGVAASPANSGLRYKIAGSNSVLMDNFSDSTAGDGFTYVSFAPVIEAQAAAAITGITAASPAVVAQVNTYSDGDIIQIYNTTGMLQIAGMNFQISSVSGAGYTLKGLRAVGFAAPATAGYTRRISKFAAVDPQFLFVTEITKASQAVVRTSVDPSMYYVIGMKVRFSVPGGMGMYQIDGLTGNVVALDSTNYTLTVDIDSSAFNAFVFPASADSKTSRMFATVAPAGVSTKFNPVTGVQTGYDFQYQPFRTGQFTPYMYLGAGANSPAGVAGDKISWISCKSEN